MGMTEIGGSVEPGFEGVEAAFDVGCLFLPSEFP